ncbi:MAG: N-acetylmuramoyl-L-alanine amidase, partial [Acidobacteriota bacterium]|nr:N-acetylmuramoyl-L-alanine amidase [Acidobacteriota bacterium]
MQIFASIEDRAWREPDCVKRLRILRRGRRQRQLWALRANRTARVVAACCALLCCHQVARSKPVPAISNPHVHALGAAPAVWVVEETALRTFYSNGLAVRREYETSSSPRSYLVYARGSLVSGSSRESLPAGIVFHTTESQILPLEPARNSALLRSREDVLERVRRGRLYNFVVDRFGQVYRIVPEGETALHAGHSIWASGDRVWVNLNESFLGVSFEAETAQGFEPSASQVHSGRLLIEVLRSRFALSEQNCVTHAQVSVNPDNMRLGYHTDWGSSFPFEKLG